MSIRSPRIVTSSIKAAKTCEINLESNKVHIKSDEGLGFSRENLFGPLTSSHEAFGFRDIPQLHSVKNYRRRELAKSTLPQLMFRIDGTESVEAVKHVTDDDIIPRVSVQGKKVYVPISLPIETSRMARSLIDLSSLTWAIPALRTGVACGISDEAIRMPKYLRRI